MTNQKEQDAKKMNDSSIKQGDIYICDLGYCVGSEQRGERPCLVVSNDILNITSSTVVVIPITSKAKKILPTHFILTQDKYPFLFYNDNTLLCECIRSVSTIRLHKHIGAIHQKDLQSILGVLSNVYTIK